MLYLRKKNDYAHLSRGLILLCTPIERPNITDKYGNRMIWTYAVCIPEHFLGFVTVFLHDFFLCNSNLSNFSFADITSTK